MHEYRGVNVYVMYVYEHEKRMGVEVEERDAFETDLSEPDIRRHDLLSLVLLTHKGMHNRTI